MNSFPMTADVSCLLAGIYSRSENLVKVSRDYDRGRAELDALSIAFEQDRRDLLKLQSDSGYTSFSDGQLRWQDFIRPFSESIHGLRSGADLSRWFDTNTFYRKPTVTSRMSSDGLFIEDARYSGKGGDFDENKRKRRSSIAIPGPFTLASLVNDKFYSSKEELVHDFARILRSVITQLQKDGYSSIQVNEPSLVYRYGESALTNSSSNKYFEIFCSAFKENLGSLNAGLILHTYFGDSSKILPDLVRLEGVSVIGLDFTQTSLESISSSLEFDGKGLGCGCVDARSSVVESPDWIADFSIQAMRALKPSKLVILPSSDLKYLPRSYADQKVRAMGEAVNIVRNKLEN